MSKKRGLGKHIDAYTNIFSTALHEAWKKKSLWMFGIFAALLNTGSLFTGIIRTAERIEPAHPFFAQSLESLAPLAPWIVEYGSKLVATNGPRLITIIVFAFLGFFFLILAGLFSQSFLLHGLNDRNKHIDFTTLTKKHRRHEIPHLFFVNALSTLALFLISVLLLPLLPSLLGTDSVYNFFVFAIFYLILLPVTFVIDAVAMFSLIHIVQKKQRFETSVATAWRTVEGHWLAIFEVALALYVLNFFLPLVFLISILLGGIFVAVSAFASLSTGTTLFMAIFSILALIAVLFLFFAAVGFLVTFNYSVWVRLAKTVEGQGLIPLFEHLGTRCARALKLIS